MDQFLRRRKAKSHASSAAVPPAADLARRCLGSLAHSDISVVPVVGRAKKGVAVFCCVVCIFVLFCNCDA